MRISEKAQFEGFLQAPQIFVENGIFEYPLFQTLENYSKALNFEPSAPPAKVLGKRMEDFFAQYITNFTSEEILIQNEQIIQGKNTVGEIDFLLKQTTSEVISHVEMIFKFYLFDPESGTSELDHLIGPNKRDSLNQKLERLQKRQFPLLFHPATKDLLNSLGLPAEDVVQKMCFKAWVFLPLNMKENVLTKINPQTLAGYWIKAKEFTPEGYDENRFFIPGKFYWPVDPKVNEVWKAFEEIEKELHILLQKKFAPLIWMKTPAGNHERFFIVWW
ncbi:DUF1853 family protein [Salinimicrobium sp. CAU 1759]